MGVFGENAHKRVRDIIHSRSIMLRKFTFDEGGTHTRNVRRQSTRLWTGTISGPVLLPTTPIETSSCRQSNVQWVWTPLELPICPTRGDEHVNTS